MQRLRGRAALLLGVAVLGAGAIAGAVVLRAPREFGSPVAWTTFGTDDVHSLTFTDESSQTVLFGHHGGVHESQDGGRSWSPLAFTRDAMGLATADAGSIVVAGHQVFEHSRDGGATWSSIPADLPTMDIHAFAQSPSDGSRMWAYLAGDGVYESTDAGTTWTLVYDGDVVTLVALSPGERDELLGVEPFRGLVRSSDGGRTWNQVGEPPASPVTTLAASRDGRVLLLGATSGLYRSDDGGRSWRRILATGTVLAAALSADGSVVGAVDQGTRFYRSDDGGVTWPGPR